MKKNTYKVILKIFILLLFLSFSNNFVSYASSEYEEFNDIDNAIQYDRPVDNDEYERIINEYKKHKEKKEKKLKKKNKYIELPENQGPSEMSIFMETLKEPITVCFTNNAYVRETGEKIPVGYYKLEMQKVNEDNNKNKYYLNLFQGHKLIAKVPSNVTNDDFGMQTINFAKVIPYDNKYLKIIYGSLEVNLEASVVLE